jgi:hypothetical protein
MGGDLLPAGYTSLDDPSGKNFINSVLLNEFTNLQLSKGISHLRK